MSGLMQYVTRSLIRDAKHALAFICLALALWSLT